MSEIERFDVLVFSNSWRSFLLKVPRSRWRFHRARHADFGNSFRRPRRLREWHSRGQGEQHADGSQDF